VTQGVSCDDLERWLEVNTFECLRTRSRITPEQCEENRKKPPIGKSLGARRSHDGSVLIHVSGYRPEACTGCTEYEALCRAVNERRKERKEEEMGKIKPEEWARTEAALKNAETFGQAAEALGIGKTTLTYRIEHNTNLQDICKIKGFGPYQKKGQGEPDEAQPTQREVDAEGDSKAAGQGWKGATADPATTEAQGIPGLVCGELESRPSVRIIIQVEGVGLDRLPGLLWSLHSPQDTLDIHTR